ncbi:plastocyanin/azurin family copper-binding protein [Daejeonella sp.]|uniref:plastocyanin/azurin family copper-binding protein n=1 Tax=Daejeonella sp. TaxID=2805397 RepID=UPI002ED9B53F
MRSDKKIFSLMLALLSIVQLYAQNNADTIRTIKIDVLVGLQFDLVRFNVKPGEKLNLIFSNSDDMSHNLLITKPGARLDVVNEALKLGQKGPELDYIPISSSVLWSIPVVNPNQFRTLSFTAPKQEGVYPYVCTLPGHGFIMFGAMYVSSDGRMPELKDDPNIPPNRRAGDNSLSGTQHTNHQVKDQAVKIKTLHPYTPVSPYIYRVFIDGASPAAIAVSLPGDLSYCWDAGTCKLRFAWSGGFLDNSELWKGKGDVSAKVVGNVFFRDKTDFPLSFSADNKTPKLDYKGYKLINRYPEFHYTINGIDVYELILPNVDGQGLIRTFSIPDVKNTVWFNTDQSDGVKYKASAGSWEGNSLRLTPKEARKFSITMTMKEGGML